MVRSVLPLVTLAACLPEMPRDVYIESRFSAREVELLRDAFAIANQDLGLALLGHPVIHDRGRIEDADGFGFDDFDDGIAVFYRLDRDSPEYRWTSETLQHAYGGYATLADLMILPRDQLGSDERFTRVALHELGHFLGLTHSPDPGALMYGGGVSASVTTYTLSDKVMFCMVHDCAYPPAP